MNFARWLHQWTGGRDMKKEAAAAVAEAFGEPDPADVSWLASLTANADDDHARWELRYAKRSFILLSARRDSLNDRTASAVSHALEEALAGDDQVDAEKVAVMNRQFNTRMRAYGEALEERSATQVDERLGRLLLSFSGARTYGAEQVQRSGQILLQMLQESNAVLRRHFGAATLPPEGTASAGAGRTA